MVVPDGPTGTVSRGDLVDLLEEVEGSKISIPTIST